MESGCPESVRESRRRAPFCGSMRWSFDLGPGRSHLRLCRWLRLVESRGMTSPKLRQLRTRWGGGWLVLACLLVVGCGSGGVAQRPGPRSAASGETAARCAQEASLKPGVAFPAWHMGAVHFFSASSGVGITTDTFPCFVHIKNGGLPYQRQPVRLAVTSDAGRSWRIVGGRLPVGPASGRFAGPERVVARSPSTVWVLRSNGRLLETSDNGSEWKVQALPYPVIGLISGGGFVWALRCAQAGIPVTSYATRNACRPELWRARAANARWTRVELPHVLAEGTFFFAVAGSHLIVALLDLNGAGEMLISNNHGRGWTMRLTPSWDHQKCLFDAALTARRPSTFWLLCTGAQAPGRSTYGLFRSTDGGRTWAIVSAVASLTQRQRPGSIPLELPPSALAAGSQTRLWLSLDQLVRSNDGCPTRYWLSLTHGLVESNDGGERWSNVHVCLAWATAFDVLNGSHAWLLGSGVGLWNTTDGLHWRADGPLHTG